MKSSIRYVAIAIAVLIPIVSVAINYNNKQVAIISYSVSIDDACMQKIKAYEELFPSVDKEKADRVIARIKDVSYAFFEEQLEREVGMYILPLNAFGSKFDYDVYGYPDMSINKAMRKGNSKYYIKVELIITQKPSETNGKLFGIINDSTPAQEIEEENSVETIQPVILYNITTYSEKGVLPIDKFSAEITATEALPLSNEFLHGLINNEHKDDGSTLMSLIDLAIARLARNIKG
ncbi:MAG: hypothetical protein JW783_12255 [Bacteroidales bacterium]|nr:hypothetical protein [Bacteroidales bacterium]MBN2748617.1 hypothetical protein [Bacteroidales bacterium]